jgi:hypothetical protein
MRLTGGGSVGIGTSSPASKLHVVSSVNTIVKTKGGTSTNQGSSYYVEKAGDTSTLTAFGDAASIIGGTPDANACIWTAGSVSLIYHIGGSEKIRFTSDGNVGIGTTSPGKKFEISDSSTQYTFRIGAGITNANYTYDIGRSTADGLLYFYGNQTTFTGYVFSGIDGERMRITSGGNVGIGTTSPSFKLDINGTTRIANTLRIDGFDTSGSQRAIGFGGNTLGTNGVIYSNGSYIAISAATNQPLYLNSDTGGNILMSGTGNVGIGTTSVVTKFVVNGGTTNTTTYTSSESRIADGSIHLMKTVAGGIFESIRAMNADTTAGTTVRFLAASTSDPFNNTNGGKVFIDAIRTSTNMDLAFSLNDVAGAAPTERVRFMGNGNVGIGTTNPVTKFYVSGSSTLSGNVGVGGNITFSNDTTAYYIKGPANGGAIRIRSNSGANVDRNVQIGNVDNVGTWTSYATFEAGGNVGIGTTAPAYKLEVNGSFAASTKSFKIDHPTKSGKKLVYGSLESPYHGIRLTGKDTLVGGKCKVLLPDYICKLVRSESVTIQLTGIKCGKTLYIDDINVSENYFVVAYEKSMLEFNKTYEFFWDFTAIRADVPELMTEV